MDFSFSNLELLIYFVFIPQIFTCLMLCKHIKRNNRFHEKSFYGNDIVGIAALSVIWPVGLACLVNASPNWLPAILRPFRATLNSLIEFLLLVDRSFQGRTYQWAKDTLPLETVVSKEERRQQFLEEALELTQACGGSKEETLMALEYVYSGPAGNLAQEVGGVSTTLNLLCEVYQVDREMAEENELERMHLKADEIREKLKLKPREY